LWYFLELYSILLVGFLKGIQMKIHLTLLIAFILLCSCEQKGKTIPIPTPRLNLPELLVNKYTQLKVGERYCFFLSWNSCCRTCSPDFKKMTHLKYIGEFYVRPNPVGCEGCTVKKAVILEAKSKGQEVFYYGSISPLDSCERNKERQEKFVVEIR